MKVIINAKIYTGESIVEKGFIRYDNKIKEISSMEEFNKEEDDEIQDGRGNIVIPGMIDIHIHGGYGIDTMDGDSEKLITLGKELLKEGVTTFFPTTMTQSIEAINKALISVKEAKTKSLSIGGIHLEGPFVNKEWKGAQPEEYITNPSIEQFKKWQHLSGNLILLVTYAPELNGSKELENYLKETEVIGSCGHTGAVYEDLQNRPIFHATHLYNQMRGLHHREPGVVGYALLTSGVKTEIITDGVHSRPEMVNLAYKLKGSKDICIITDSMRAKGLSDGIYELGGQPVKVVNGKATLDNGSLAGSILTMDKAFRNVIKFTNCSIEDAVKMTSTNQAKEFNLTNKGVLDKGRDADFVILDQSLHVINTIQFGNALY